MALKNSKISKQERNKTAGKEALRAYSQNSKRNLKQQRITDFLPMVTSIVNRVVSYLKPPLTFEDLVSAGTVGLIKAARDFDPSQNAEFKTYAYIRIKGAVLDELRGWSFVPNTVNKKIKDAREASIRLTDEKGNQPTEKELADELGIPQSELQHTFRSMRVRNFLSIDSSVGDKTDETTSLRQLLASTNVNTPDQQVEKAELIEMLSKAIRSLPEKQRQVILLYYQQHLTMKETAEVFGITESRVSQLHASALFNLSVKLKKWKNGG